MTKQIIRKPTQADVEYLIENVRPEDIEEVEAFDGSTVAETLHDTPDLLENSEVWEVDGKIVCMFGVTPVKEFQGVGVIWMLATAEFDKHAMVFAVNCKKVVKKMIKGYEFVFNYVHTKNTKSVEWLKWLGFVMHDPAPMGPKNELFTRFEMETCVTQ